MSFIKIKNLIKGLAFDVDYWSVRYIERRDEFLQVRQNVIEPPRLMDDLGIMISVYHKGGQGYAGTADLSEQGIKQAFNLAKHWAELSADHSVMPFDESIFDSASGEYKSPIKENWFEVAIKTKLDRLQAVSQRLKTHDHIVDWSCGFWAIHWDNYFLSSNGAEQFQSYQLINPEMSVTGFDQGVSETRTFGGQGICRQGGYEVLADVKFDQAAESLPRELLQLLAAPHCPTGAMDVLLEPDQMILQIHESIGHPLELDRILGDERNYAGTSFVTRDMFGTYQYGSELLNVTFDPTLSGEFASYQFDDEGSAAQKVYLIEQGILKRGLGGALSQKRSGIEGVANSRSVGWNRPPIDRMANLNLEPGTSSMSDMIGSIEYGVLMKTNCSWSIDDSRNKFQFGCEYGQVIRNGELAEVVRKPNYRGISASFWRSLSQVGNQESRDILGTPYCGKGEPNQAIAVGHASPACVFKNIEVFGGE
ncbi:TldD/PmbA family protein [Pseudobacteriovorax antillogorgiicola]|uniref:Predicted Zn-dependent protease or its inactivated homolog n=1 Tax=Pseudobacteriovorax antillogorgiicola TaxID=1513793 RepID=A0A1Y6CH54_9BACT|nr:TldD/PmbA family protein [Pseudobacteriovorax antillogorgiicola]TCS48601.1 putative Zn-dependent protease [Pseudobacteriovorax antillogorgiicola]SMF55570.1 Predicted Zn-dependent protease or its inactivated homolog [Pseudobacteriovorax antillogorgiicola]